MPSKIGRELAGLRRLLRPIGSPFAPEWIHAEDGLQFVLDVSRLAGLGTAPGRPCRGYRTQGPTAGDQAYIYLSNPDDSKVIVLVERVILFSNLAQRVRWARTSSELGVAGGNSMIVDELAATSPIAKMLAYSTASSIATIQGRASLQADIDRTVELGYILPPGEAIRFETETVNSRLDVSFFWREESVD